jgi:hypothetical protein
MNNRFSKTPEPPYYAVIFTNQLSKNDEGYHHMGEKNVRNGFRTTGLFGR